MRPRAAQAEGEEEEPDVGTHSDGDPRGSFTNSSVLASSTVKTGAVGRSCGTYGLRQVTISFSQLSTLPPGLSGLQLCTYGDHSLAALEASGPLRLKVGGTRS